MSPTPRPRSNRALLVGTLVVVVLGGGLVGAGALGRQVFGDRGPTETCHPADHPDWSVARRWDEVLLDAIRRDLPMPTVHARNLFHLSAAMWDAWAAYDPNASGELVDDKVDAAGAAGVAAARDVAVSYAAYRLLTARYIAAVGADRSLSRFDDLMDALCLPIAEERTTGDDPAALGNRIAARYLAATVDDGSNEAGGYAPTGYRPVNAPLVVKARGNAMTDPRHWQPLKVDNMVTQNGIPIALGVQTAIGVHWGRVRPFALPDGGGRGVPIDPGPPPELGDPSTGSSLVRQLVEVIRLQSQLDPSSGVTIDISPSAYGNSTLGTNDGRGRPTDPATGAPYPANVVPLADFGRVMAEFWADGPASETPPGHWNVLANEVSDRLGADLRIGGTGPSVARLEWDVKLYLALNGAVHDAAIEAWGLKGVYDSARPISLIRYLGERGELPLVPGLIERVTSDQTRPGGPMAALRGHEGEVAVRAWGGSPPDRQTQVGGIAWRLAADWVPYQMPTFVTPAFPAYVSGHSTFSRAAAEVMAAFTGSPYFPGGELSYTIPTGGLEFEAGPSRDVTLQWATYADAADQAGRSRLWGGIHIEADDLTGRRLGAECGRLAWARAQALFGGTAP